MKKTKNKREWTELLVFVKLLTEQKLFLSDKDLNAKTNFFNLKKITTHNLDLEFYIIDKSVIEIKNKISEETVSINISSVLNEKVASFIFTKK